MKGDEDVGWEDVYPNTDSYFAMLPNSESYCVPTGIVMPDPCGLVVFKNLPEIACTKHREQITCGRSQRESEHEKKKKKTMLSSI